MQDKQCKDYKAAASCTHEANADKYGMLQYKLVYKLQTQEVVVKYNNDLLEERLAMKIQHLFQGHWHTATRKRQLSGKQS